MFKLWSEYNPEAVSSLKPNLGFRDWGSITEKEKELMWKHLETYFFVPVERKRWVQSYSGSQEDYFESQNTNNITRIYKSIAAISYHYKVRNLASNFIVDQSEFSACRDFLAIFKDFDHHAVIELLSFYCKALLFERENSFYHSPSSFNSKEQYESKKLEWELEKFNEFQKDLNDVFTDFGVNVSLTSSGFIPRQDEKIIQEIFEPVMQCLAHPQWNEVNKLLSDAYKKYRENSPAAYSTCVTHVVAAVEAFLQIVVKGKTGQGEFAGLVSEGQRKGLIPSDMFTRDMFKTIISIIMKERKETGDAHVKQSYASERNAKMVLNLAMIFIQHCVVK